MLIFLVHQTKEEMVGTVEAVQALQVQSGHLQKSKEVYHAKCLELDRLRKEGAPLKELEKVSRDLPTSVLRSCVLSLQQMLSPLLSFCLLSSHLLVLLFLLSSVTRRS